MEAIDFKSQLVYAPTQPPRYAAWASLFPGENGKWYIGFDTLTHPAEPLPQFTPEQWYGIGLPVGYDESQYLMEAVIMESSDGLQNWKEMSRQQYRYRHASFAMARTNDARLLRFVWNLHFSSPDETTNAVFYESSDNGKTWDQPQMPLFYNVRFHGYPHRLRTLHDGTLVLCMLLGPKWGEGTDRPIRCATDPSALNDMGYMTLYFSFDQGRSWNGPLPIFSGVYCSETDFVELPDGNLLFFQNRIFAHQGRQFVYRDEQRFTPGPLQDVRSGAVPETVCLTEDGILVGCHRAGSYSWSNDLGQTWNQLSGVAGSGQMYQPWIQWLPDGRIACVGHNGSDDPVGTGRPSDYSNNVFLHTFRLKVSRRTENTSIWVERDYDAAQKRWPNSYTISLTSDGKPVPDKELEIWHVERYKPGYDSFGSRPLAELMKLGGTLLKLRTNASGKARLQMPAHLDKTTNQHMAYRLIVRFNMDRSDPDYKPCQSRVMEFYALQYMPPKLRPLK